MLINDNRACATAVNNQIEDWNNKRGVQPVNGEVAYYHKALLFSHFDSRGGSTLFLRNETIVDGMKQYNKLFEMPDNHDIAFEDLTAGSNGYLRLIVVGQDLPESGELLHEHGGEYLLYRLETRYDKLDGDFSEWLKSEVAVLVHLNEDQSEEFNKDREERDLDDENGFAQKLAKTIKFIGKDNADFEDKRFVLWEVGEDAFGLFLPANE